jgi:hypothetical protein
MSKFRIKNLCTPILLAVLGWGAIPNLAFSSGFVRPTVISIGSESEVRLNQNSSKDENGKGYACYSLSTSPGQLLTVNVTSNDASPVAIIGRGSLCNAYRLVDQSNPTATTNKSTAIRLDAQGGQYLIIVKSNDNSASSNFKLRVDELSTISERDEPVNSNLAIGQDLAATQPLNVGDVTTGSAASEALQNDVARQRRIALMQAQSLAFGQKLEAEALRERQIREAQEQAQILAQQQYEAEQRAKKRRREEAFNSFMSGVAIAAQVVATEAPAIMARQQQEQAASAARLVQQQAQIRELQAQQQRAAEQQRMESAQAQQQRDQQLMMQSRRAVQQQQSGAIRSTTTTGAGQTSTGYGIGYSPATTNQARTQQSLSQSQLQSNTNQIQLTQAQRTAINNQEQSRIRQNEEAQFARQRQIEAAQTQSYISTEQYSQSTSNSNTQLASNSAPPVTRTYPPVPEAVVVCSPHPTRAEYFHCWAYRDNMRSLIGPNETSGWKSPENFNSYLGCNGAGSSGPFSLTDGGMYWRCGFGADGKHNRDAAVPSGAIILSRDTFYCDRGEPFCRRRDPSGR